MRKIDRQDLAQSLVPVAALRRAQAPLRVLIAVLIGVFFVWGRHQVAMWLWLGAYAGAQVLEVWALWSFREGRRESSPLRAKLALAAIVLLAASVASMALFLWRMPGSLGPAAATLLLCQGALNVLSTSRGCRAAFAAGVAPYGIAAMLLPLSWGLRESEAAQPAFLLAIMAFISTLLVIWRDGERLNQSERAAIADLDARRREAEAAVSARAAFTAAVSHELRTPLSAILAGSAALEARALSEQNRDSAAMIGEASRLMRRLLDDLLDFSKLEAGRMGVEAADFDLAALIDDTARFWAAEGVAKGLALELVGREALPARVRGDALRLRQVLNNLLSNAIKFTERGGVRVELAAVLADARRPSAGWRVSVAVADTGAGLGDGRLDRLFDPFEQADAGIARTHGGTGLGLAISRELARLMGGDLVASHRQDAQGARFVLDVPLQAALAGTAPPPSVETQGEVRVLVVDDHPLGRQALTTLLGLRGLEVSACPDGATALAMLQARRFDLVLADLNMGELGGREMARRLRAENGPNRDAPVLAVSGEGGEEALAACLAAGMYGLVVKPLEPRTLYAAVDAALAAGRAEAGNAADNRSASAASSLSSHSQTVSTVQPAARSAA